MQDRLTADLLPAVRSLTTQGPLAVDIIAYGNDAPTLVRWAEEQVRAAGLLAAGITPRHGKHGAASAPDAPERADGVPLWGRGQIDHRQARLVFRPTGMVGVDGASSLADVTRRDRGTEQDRVQNLAGLLRLSTSDPALTRADRDLLRTLARAHLTAHPVQLHDDTNGTDRGATVSTTGRLLLQASTTSGRAALRHVRQALTAALTTALTDAHPNLSRGQAMLTATALIGTHHTLLDTGSRHPAPDNPDHNQGQGTADNPFTLDPDTSHGPDTDTESNPGPDAGSGPRADAMPGDPDLSRTLIAIFEIASDYRFTSASMTEGIWYRPAPLTAHHDTHAAWDIFPPHDLQTRSALPDHTADRLAEIIDRLRDAVTNTAGDRYRLRAIGYGPQATDRAHAIRAQLLDLARHDTDIRTTPTLPPVLSTAATLSSLPADLSYRQWATRVRLVLDRTHTAGVPLRPVPVRPRITTGATGSVTRARRASIIPDPTAFDRNTSPADHYRDHHDGDGNAHMHGDGDMDIDWDLTAHDAPFTAPSNPPAPATDTDPATTDLDALFASIFADYDPHIPLPSYTTSEINPHVDPLGTSFDLTGEFLTNSFTDPFGTTGNGMPDPLADFLGSLDIPSLDTIPDLNLHDLSSGQSWLNGPQPQSAFPPPAAPPDIPTGHPHPAHTGEQFPNNWLPATSGRTGMDWTPDTTGMDWTPDTTLFPPPNAIANPIAYAPPTFTDSVLAHTPRLTIDTTTGVQSAPTSLRRASPPRQPSPAPVDATAGAPSPIDSLFDTPPHTPTHTTAQTVDTAYITQLLRDTGIPNEIDHAATLPARDRTHWHTALERFTASAITTLTTAVLTHDHDTITRVSNQIIFDLTDLYNDHKPITY